MAGCSPFPGFSPRNMFNAMCVSFFTLALLITAFRPPTPTQQLLVAVLKDQEPSFQMIRIWASGGSTRFIDNDLSHMEDYFYMNSH